MCEGHLLEEKTCKTKSGTSGGEREGEPEFSICNFSSSSSSSSSSSKALIEET